MNVVILVYLGIHVKIIFKYSLGEEAISAAVSEENAPMEQSGEAQTAAAAFESAAASEESANEAVECSATVDEKNDSPDQSL